VKIFFDNTIPVRIARGLEGFAAPDHQVIHFRDRFSADAADAVWMGELAAQQDWVIVTCDVRLGRNPLETEAWKAVGHCVFFLKPGWLRLGFWEQAQQLVKCFPRLIESAQGAQGASMFAVSASGKITKALIPSGE